MKQIPIFLALWIVIWALIFNQADAATRLHTENFYAVPHCQSVHGANNGEPTRLADGTFVDCQTPFADVEYDFADKYYECFTQAIHYSNIDGRQPVCILITENAHACDLYERAKVDFASIPRPVMLLTIGPYQCAK